MTGSGCPPRRSERAVLPHSAPALGLGVGGSSGQVAIARPIGQHVDVLGQVGLGVEPVQLAGHYEPKEVGGSAGVVVGAEEYPCLATARLPRRARSECLLVMGNRRSSRKRGRAASCLTA